MSIAFDESKHRRGGDGRFAHKAHATAEAEVSFGDMEDEQTAPASPSGEPACLAVPSAANLPLAANHPHLPHTVRFGHESDRVVTVVRDGREEAYLMPNDMLMSREMEQVRASRRTGRPREPMTFTDEELASYPPAPLQSPIRRPEPRLRDFDINRVPKNRRAAVERELDRELPWLPKKADGSPGTIRNEIVTGRITGKRREGGQVSLRRTSIPDGSSQAAEDASHKTIGVSKSLFNALRG